MKKQVKYDSYKDFPEIGEMDIFYIDESAGVEFFWDGVMYMEVYPDHA